MALGNVFIKDVDGNIPYDTGTRYLFSRFGIYHGERNHTALGLRPSQTYRTQKYK